MSCYTGGENNFMKKTASVVVLCFVLCLILPHAFADYSPELFLQLGHSNSVQSVAFSPDGQTLASGSSDATIKLWEVRTGKLLTTLEGHSDWVGSMAFGPDGQTLASGSNDNTIKLWEVRTGKLRATLAGHSRWVQSMAFSPDGQTLASGSNDTTPSSSGRCARASCGPP